MKSSMHLNASADHINATDSNDCLLSRAAAAQYLGVATQTLAAWAHSRRYNVEMVKIGSRAMYKKSALDAFIAARTISAVDSRKEDARHERS